LQKRKMSIFHIYYIEIKNRFLLIIFSWILTILICYNYKEILLFLIIEPSLDLIGNVQMHFIFTNVVEIFSIYMKVIFWVSNHLLIFYLAYHTFLFISPGLYRIEYIYTSYIITTSIKVWIFSVYFFDKLIFPFSWSFFSSYWEFSIIKSVNFYFESKIEEYVTFFIQSYYVCILYFQVVTVFSLFFNLVKNDLLWLKHIRKNLYCFFIIFTTIVTPPDIYSQVFLSLILITLYELLFLVSIVKITTKKILNH
jgi:sec-independent protein translocase protein TatC